MTICQIERATRGGSDVVYAKKKRKKPTARKLAKRYADDWCRAYAHKMFDNCVTCGAGKEKVLQWGHLLTGECESTRWDIDNFAIQCSGCNMRHEHDFTIYLDWFMRERGPVRYEALVARHHKPAHFKTADLIEIGNAFKILCEENA
jgi:hypothetical protein